MSVSDERINHDNGVEEYTLDNGLKVILQQNSFSPVVAMQVWTKVGSADETDEQAGMAHVLEHMLFKGTDRRAVGEIAREVEGAGGDINAWTSFDQTVYHIVIAERYHEMGLDILSDAVAHSTLDEEELARELEVIVEEIKRGRDNPEHKLSEELMTQVFPTHPYGKPIIGTEDSVRSFNREKLMAFKTSWYTPKNMILVVVGDFEPERIKQTIERLFGSIETSDQPERNWPAEKEQTEPRHQVMFDNIQEAHFGLGFAVPGLSHDDLPALDLMAMILGQGDSSRLVSRLRRKTATVSDVFAYPYVGADQGVFFIESSQPFEKAAEALEAIGEEVARMAKYGPLTRELEKAKSLSRHEITYQTQTVQGKARRLGYFKTLTGDVNFHRKYLEQVRLVTAGDIRRVTQKYFAPERLNISLLLPESVKDQAPDSQAWLDTFEQGRAKIAKGEGGKYHADENGITRAVLDNGITVLVKENRNVPLVAYEAAVPAGLRMETKETNGINYLCAKLLTLGTGSRGGLEIAETMDRLAGGLSGFSGRNTLGLKGQIIAEHLDQGLDLFAECLLDPVFSQEELDKERIQVLEQIRTKDDQPSRVAFDLFVRTLYPEHPFGMDMIGTKENVESFTSQDLKDYYKRILSPERLVISVVGDVETDAILASIEERFGGLKPSDEPFEPPQPPTPAQTSSLVTKELVKEQAHLIVGFLGLTFTDPDRYAMQVLNTILSGQGGRLFLELRDRRSLAYAVGSSSLESLDPGHFTVYIGTTPEKLDEARTAILEELGNVIAEPPDEEDVEWAKRYLIGSHAVSLQKNDSVASSLLFDELYDLGYDHHLRYTDNLAAVKPEDVLRVARRVIRLGTETIAIVGPNPGN